jgi:hypothetical protein
MGLAHVLFYPHSSVHGGNAARTNYKETSTREWVFLASRLKKFLRISANSEKPDGNSCMYFILHIEQKNALFLCGGEKTN